MLAKIYKKRTSQNIRKYEEELGLNNVIIETPESKNKIEFEHFVGYYIIFEGCPGVNYWYALNLENRIGEKYTLYLPNRESLDNYWDYKIKIGDDKLKNTFTKITAEHNIFTFELENS